MTAISKTSSCLQSIRNDRNWHSAAESYEKTRLLEKIASCSEQKMIFA